MQSAREKRGNGVHRLIPALFPVGFSLVLLCSCATRQVIEVATGNDLPDEITINQGAGRGDYLFLKLSWEGGEELLFGVDTGCPITILDKALESRLGKRLGTVKARYAWFGKATLAEYAAPALY